MAGGLEAELARRTQIQQPGRQHAFVDDGAAAVGDALAVERLRAQPALAVRVVDDRDRLREDAIAEPVLQKARAARDRGSRDRPQQMRDKTARDARVENHWAAAGRHLLRAQTLDRALAGALADFG